MKTSEHTEDDPDDRKQADVGIYSKGILF